MSPAPRAAEACPCGSRCAAASESGAARAAMPATLPSTGHLQFLARPLVEHHRWRHVPNSNQMHRAQKANLSRRHVSSLLARCVVKAVALVNSAGGGGFGGAAAVPRCLHRRLVRGALQQRRLGRGLGAFRLPLLPLGPRLRQVSFMSLFVISKSTALAAFRLPLVLLGLRLRQVNPLLIVCHFSTPTQGSCMLHGLDVACQLTAGLQHRRWPRVSDI